MSVTASLSNAMSGLTATAKAAEVVSSNVANATTEGYATRSVVTSAASLGGVGTGVRIEGVSRSINEIILADRRAADADLASASARASYYATLETEIGLPGDPGSLQDVLNRFEGALVDAASRPDQPVRLDAAADAAATVAEKVNAIAASIQAERLAADGEIARQVALLNQTLGQLEELNADISLQRAAGHDALGLMDQRQILVDRIAAIVPVSVIPRDASQIALVTTGGGVLLDGRAAELGFTPVNMIAPEMMVETGALSQVTLNGQVVDLSRGTNMLGGGSLEALFSIRDVRAPAAQAELDAFAHELISRFADPAVDGSLSLGQPGLFTDAGGPFTAPDTVGLSQRLALNAAVDPTLGGEAWRLRDGVAAAAPGPEGNAAQLLAFVDVLSQPRSPAVSPMGGGQETVFSLASGFLSQVANDGLQSQDSVAFASARWEALRTAELEGGVDTDAEMQKLLRIEQAYAANARVISAIEEMLDSLLRI